MYTQLCDLCLQQFTNDFNMPKCAVLNIVQCKKTEAAGTIVYASDHKKMRVYPVSFVSRKCLLKLKNQESNYFESF